MMPADLGTPETWDSRPWLRSQSDRAPADAAVAGSEARAGLAENWLLRDVAPERIESLVAASEERRFTASDTIFREGDAVDGVYLVQSGTVRIVTHAVDGGAWLAGVGVGDWFGEMGVIDGAPRSATAMAATFVVLRFVPTEAFLDLLQAAPLVSLRLLVLLSDRLRRTNRLVAELPGGVTRARANVET